MRSFQEFLELAEKYYSPGEKLPSGNTPFIKALTSYEKKEKEYNDGTKKSLKHATRMAKQVATIRTKVLHGADNPDFNLHSDINNEVDVSGKGDRVMRVTHPKSGVKFTVRNSGEKTKDGKPVHDVMWNHPRDYGSLSDDDKKHIIRSARDIWVKHVSHRLPHGSVIRNFPISNNGRNARSSLYSRIGGFGKRDPDTGYQFASVGREPSPKQKAKDKSKKRTSPMPSRTKTYYGDDDL